MNWNNTTETMKTVTRDGVVANPETTAAQNASAMFILKEQNGGANGTLNPSMKSSTFKRNGVRSEEQENNGQVLNQKYATLPVGISDNKKKITVSKKGKTHFASLKSPPFFSRSIFVTHFYKRKLYVLCELHFLDLKTFQPMFVLVLCRDLRPLRVTADSAEIPAN